VLVPKSNTPVSENTPVETMITQDRKKRRKNTEKTKGGKIKKTTLRKTYYISS
jgi:hypothetical protein